MLAWTGFSLAILSLICLSRYNLALGMTVAAVTLAAFTLSLAELGQALLATVSDPSVLLLAGVVGLIPMIGGALEVSGQMDRLVGNMRIGRKPFLAVSPALLGMLPMPGGALLSAPLVEGGAGADTPADTKAAVNIWFRHALLLVYPLGPTLIVSAKIAKLDVYQVIIFLAPAFLLMSALGYLLLLRSVDGKIEYKGRFSLCGVVTPLLIIFVAPGLDFAVKRALHLPYPEIGAALGVTASFVLAVAVGRLKAGDIRRVWQKMRPWKFSLIIFAMFIFLNVFNLSGIPEALANINLFPVMLCVVVAFVLGMVTGRIQTAASIIIPIFLYRHGMMSSAVFAVTYFAIFLGYIISPVHPCVSISVGYFSTSMAALLKKLSVPVAIAVLVNLGIAFLII